MPKELTPASAVKQFFNMDLPAMKTEWVGNDPAYTGAKLTGLDKGQIASGVLDGSLTYEATAEQIAAAKARTIEVPGGPDFVLA